MAAVQEAVQAAERRLTNEKRIARGGQMADQVVISLSTGLEDAERVTVAFLVGGAALEKGKRVAMFLTKETVRLALPGYGEAVACEGCPPLPRLFGQYVDGGGELLVCPICSARASSTTPNWRGTRASRVPRHCGTGSATTT